MKETVRQIDGEFWFTAAYAAKLLATTRNKVEAMAVRGLLRSLDQGALVFVAEADVTRLRRNPQELAQVKEAAKMPAHPRKGEKMPAGTTYVGETPKAGAAARIGHPLKDEGRRS